MKIRAARPDDGDAVMALAERAYSPRPVWSNGDGWRRFFFGYPGDGAAAFLAVDDQDIPLGHCGFLPTKVSGKPACYQTNAFIAPECRDGDLLRQIVTVGEAHACHHGASFLITFTSKRVAVVFRRLLGWTIVGTIAFTRKEVINPHAFANRLHFQHPPEWYTWRFGEEKNSYVLPYTKDRATTLQAWKTVDGTSLLAPDFGATALDCWHPDGYSSDLASESETCFLVKNISDPVNTDVLNIHNWYIEIGDSDLAYRPLGSAPHPF